MEDTNIKKIHENENPKKVANIVEKILNFNEQMNQNVNSQENASKITNSSCITKSRLYI